MRNETFVQQFQQLAGGVTDMYLTPAERVVVQSASCRLAVDEKGREIAVLMDTKVPWMFTLLSISSAVRAW